MITQANIPQFSIRYATSGSAAVSGLAAEKFRERATGRLFRTIVPVLHFTFCSVFTVEVRSTFDLFAVSAFIALPSRFIRFPRVSEKSLDPSNCRQHDQLLHSSFTWSPGIVTVRALVSIRGLSGIALIGRLINRSLKFDRLGSDTPLPVLSLFPVSTQRKSESELHGARPVRPHQFVTSVGCDTRHSCVLQTS